MSLLDRFRKKEATPALPEPPARAVPTAPSTSNLSSGDLSAVNSAIEASSAAAPSSPEAPVNAAVNDPAVRVFDDFGREVLIPASQWRRELLPNALEQARHHPDALAPILLDALQLGAAAEILPAAAHLGAIDPQKDRGATVHGLVLLANGQAAAAEDVFITYLGQFGPSSVVLAHLARAQGAQGRLDEADATLWRALEADPNQDHAVGLYAARGREQGGDAGWQSALERAATLPNAWLPLLWLGRLALEGGNRALAVGLYKEALDRGGVPTPPVLLQGISGDLGQRGLLDDAVRLTRSAFDPAVHGLFVGNNLIKATLDLGQTADALALVRELDRQGRPEWTEPLRAWVAEIRRRELGAAKEPPQPALLRIDGPIWLPPNSPARALYSGTAPRRAGVLFLGSSATLAQPLTDETAQLPDAAGRLSRALPLYLAEGAWALLGFEAATLVPWAEGAGFAMLGQPWPDDAAAAYAREAGAVAAVAVHLEATAEGATATLRIIPAAHAPGEAQEPEAVVSDRLANAEPVEQAPESSAYLHTAPFATTSPEPATVTVTLNWGEVHAGAQSLWGQLAHHLVAGYGDAAVSPQPGRYTLPRGTDLNLYLSRLEQLLGVFAAGAGRDAALLLTGERDLVRGLVDLVVRYPASLPVRLALHEALLRLRDLRPELLGIERGPVRLLQERFPFPDPEVNRVLTAQLDTVFAMQPMARAN